MHCCVCSVHKVTVYTLVHMDKICTSDVSNHTFSTNLSLCGNAITKTILRADAASYKDLNAVGSIGELIIDSSSVHTQYMSSVRGTE